MADLTHLAVVVGDERHRARTEAEGLVRAFNELHAAEYLSRLRRGDPGAAARYLGGLRRSSGVDPWALAEVVAARVLAASELGPVVAVTGPAEVSAPAAAVGREDYSDGIG